MDTQHLNAPPWMEPLRQLVVDRHGDAEAPQLLQLARQILRPADSGVATSVNSLYGSLRSAWTLLARRDPQQTKVRVYNPDPIRDGWQCRHTIVDILMDDMPFIVASCVTELMRQGVRVYRQIYPIFHIRRDADGAFQGFCEEGETGAEVETLVRFEIDHQLNEEDLDHIGQRLQSVLRDVRSVVEDWQAMLERVDEAASWCENSEACRSFEDNREAVELLRWLADEAFLFIGFRYYSAEKTSQGLYRLHYEPGSGLGSFREPVAQAQQTIELDEDLSRQLESPGLLVLTKSSTRSTVRQDSHYDYVGVKKTDEQGAVLGEWRFFGLYASKAYDTPITQIPLIRRHVRQLLELSHLPSNTHGYKALRHLIWTYPREELLQAGFDQLRESIFGMLECVERRQLGIFLRPDTYGRFINVLMLIPRDQYNTDVRMRVQELLLRQLHGNSSEFGVHLSEQPLALIQFTIHCHSAHRLNLDREELQRLVADTVESWHDKLHQALLKALGEAEGNRLFARFGRQLPAAYREDHGPGDAVADLRALDALRAPLTTQLYHPDQDGTLRFKVLGHGRTLALSDVLPILEHLGVRVLDATPYQIAVDGNDAYWILDFGLASESELDPSQTRLRTQFQETFIRTYYGELEDDRFNQLVLRAGISYREIALLRALCKYLLQLGLPFSQHYIEQAMSRNPDICRQLLALFAARFDPDAPPGNKALSQLLGDDILASLEQVDNLDEDRILRHYLGVIRAMLRTNYYQTGNSQKEPGGDKGYLSFKINTRALPFAPEPRPAFEIFVYAPWV
ncbi:NAD-glutamate dehydrogenase domain-containing protein, partial [Marinobacterium nitratireducens]|uniref:NAD-glutamate dehydrogenase domain-containing protein n=1 Tax=Marinobacterium nitratireducens TaxID=518897 RepID=UPI001668BC1C